MAARYDGMARGPVVDGREPATGPVVIQVDDRGRVTGNVKLGAAPDWAGTGFSGMRVGNSIRASGQNRRSGSGKVFDLEVALEGDIGNDGKSLNGVMGVWLNVPDVERAEASPVPYTFTTALSAGRPLKAADEPTTGELEDWEAMAQEESPEIPVEEPSLWDRIPDWAKVAGAGGAVLGGLALFKKLRG